MNESDLSDAHDSADGARRALCDLVNTLPESLNRWEKAVTALEGWRPRSPDEDERVWAAAAAVLIDIDLFNRELRSKATQIRGALKDIRKGAKPIVERGRSQRHPSTSPGEGTGPGKRHDR